VSTGKRSPTFQEPKESKDVFINRSSSANLRNLISKGKLPDHLLEKLDLDRICEQEEDFLNTDRKRELALNKGSLKPKILAVK
jgi:hypothetical protein